MDKKVTLAQLKEVVQEAYDQVKTNTGGKNADYIPYLANVNKDLFGISVCLLNGQTIHVGDTDYRFGIESVSKVHTASWHCANTVLKKSWTRLERTQQACPSIQSSLSCWRTTIRLLRW